MPCLSLRATRRLAPILRHFTSSIPRVVNMQNPTFPNSPVPLNPLGGNKPIRHAACLIIGDEVLNGKTHDTNSNYLAKFCFEHGIDLKRIEVIPDDEAEIIEAARRMTEKYDFVVTSGGIGPTHDDITYESLAKAFDQQGRLAYHDETLHRMGEHLKARSSRGEIKEEPTEQQVSARKRMALLPIGQDGKAEALFVLEDLWVPIVRLQGKLIVLPGVPRLFRSLLDGMIPYLPLPPASEKPYRLIVSTPQPESAIAPFLSALSKRVQSEDIRVGSYPKEGSVDVSLIGKNKERLEQLSEEVCGQLAGKRKELEKP